MMRPKHQAPQSFDVAKVAGKGVAKLAHARESPCGNRAAIAVAVADYSVVNPTARRRGSHRDQHPEFQFGQHAAFYQESRPRIC
jgi:hypothetical protein